MLDASIAHLIVLIIFIVGYLAIIFEHTIKVNKAGAALLMAVLAWTFVFVIRGHSASQLFVRHLLPSDPGPRMEREWRS